VILTHDGRVVHPRLLAALADRKEIRS
jgi:hypothetical protein